MAWSYVPEIGALVTREDAKERGLKHYFTGVKCNRGHVSRRYVSTGQCLACVFDHTARWRHENPEKVVAGRKRRLVARGDKIRAGQRESYKRHAERRRADAAARYWRERDRILFGSRAYRKRNGEEIRKRSRERYAANPEHFREIARNYFSRNPEKCRERRRRHKASNPIGNRASVHRRKAIKRNAPGSYTQHDVLRILERQRYRCVYCKRSLKVYGYHVDHKVALSRGGSNWPANLQCLCPECNNRKHVRDDIEFAQSMGLLL